MASAVEAAIRSVVTKGVTTIAKLNRSMQDKDRVHPFLTGIHAPLSEERTLTDLRVTGVIPVELDGRYVRIGPNPFKPDPRGHHWFLGDGMVHGVRLKDGKALWYRNRYIRSLDLEEKGGPKAAPGPRRGRRDLVNTNVIQHNGKTLAIVEAGSFPAELDENLETVAYTDFGGTLQVPFSAHPHEDPLTGELHAVVYDGMVQDTVWHVVVTRDGRVIRQEPIPVQHGPSIHECSITRNYVLVFDLPARHFFDEGADRRPAVSLCLEPAASGAGRAAAAQRFGGPDRLVRCRSLLCLSRRQFLRARRRRGGVRHVGP